MPFGRARHRRGEREEITRSDQRQSAGFSRATFHASPCHAESENRESGPPEATFVDI